MRPLLIPLTERLGRYALRRRGVRTRWMPTPLGRVHVYDAPGQGTLPTTVLLHGISSSATPFGPVLARLARHVRRVVAPDYPGHGFTPAPAGTLTPEGLLGAMTGVLDALIDEPAIVVGNSLGGLLALHYAIARPERVRALVLMSPGGAPSTDAEWSALKGAFDFDSRAGGLAFLARVYHRTPLIAHLVAHELSASTGRRVVRDLLDAATNEHAPTPEALAALPMPVLLVWGQSERLLPDSHLDYYARHLPQRTVVERPEGYGHCAHVDQPGRVAARIVSFAREIRRGDDVRE
jgi:pimeloyl-ACP methyl ester carboxylesterase